MKERTHHLFLGIGFVFLGAVMLLEEFGIFRIDEEYTFAILCLLGSIAFFRRHHDNSAMINLILSAVLLFISAAIIIDAFSFVDDSFTGILLFVLLTMLFVYGFTLDRNRVGLLIPAGIFLTLASMIFLDEIVSLDGEYIGCMFFLGIGLTFGFIFLIQDKNDRQEWARFLAIGFIGFAVFVFVVSTDVIDAEGYLPLIMIAAGSYLIYRGRKKNSSLMTAK